MKRTTLIFSFFIFFITVNIHAKSTVTPTKTLKTTGSIEPIAPSIKKGEFSLFFNESYIVFKTKEFQKLELSENCFKNSVPNCIAFKTAQVKPPIAKIEYAGTFNVAAINCANMGGKNLIGTDFENKSYNFCRFGDGSMITSWSMYFKYNPAQIAK